MSRIAEAAYGDTPAPYPKSPGHRGQETSKEAARKFKAHAEDLRAQVLAHLALEPSTVHETAAALRVPVPSVQPRFSELSAMEKIERMPALRRKNASGMSAAVWIVRRAP
jgi:predicted Rossmann fold nucleotide-binding protein DprA/Smf involved in DNA uptake